MIVQDIKEAWKKARAEYDELHAEAVKLLGPLGAKLEAAEMALDAIEDGGFIGQCEACGEPLFEEEPTYTCADGEPLCEKCAPTYNDLMRDPEAFGMSKDVANRILAGLSPGKCRDERGRNGSFLNVFRPR